MIFNSQHVEALVAEWVVSADGDLLAHISHGSLPLAEVVASKYSDDDLYRQDLIQECMVKLPYCLRHYKAEYSLHKYLTSVFHNCCRDYITKFAKYDHEELQDVHTVHDVESELDDILEALIIHNRKRFPSIPTDVLDSLTVHIFNMLCEGVKPKATALCDNYDIPQQSAGVIVNSIIIWLRRNYSSFALNEFSVPSEFTLLPELMEILGNTNYGNLLVYCAGMTLKLPT